MRSYKSITVKTGALLEKGKEYEEYEYPKLNNYLNEGWSIKEVHQITTNENVGFLFLTFILTKN